MPHLAVFDGARCLQGSSLVSMSWRQLVGGGGNVGEPGLSSDERPPEGPWVIFVLGAMRPPPPLSHPAGCPVLGTVHVPGRVLCCCLASRCTSGILASSSGNGDGLRGCGAG